MLKVTCFDRLLQELRNRKAVDYQRRSDGQTLLHHAARVFPTISILASRPVLSCFQGGGALMASGLAELNITDGFPAEEWDN